MTIAESMACGTPTIVYNSTACPELIGENTGFIINPKDFNKVMELIKKYVLTGKKTAISNHAGNILYIQRISLRTKHTINIFHYINTYWNNESISNNSYLQ